MSSESTEAWLERLDQLRYEDGERALKELWEGADRVPQSLFPRYLGVCGSAFRTTDAQLENAQNCLRIGMWLVEQLGDRSAIADLLQRQSYVRAHQGGFATSLRLAEHATGIHLGCGDLPSAGKALVDQGIFLDHLGRYEEAIQTHKLSLQLLATNAQRHRFAALLALGSHHRNLGDPRQAVRYLKAAVPVGKGLGPWFEAKAIWLHGEILTDLGLDDRAESEFQAVFDIYRERSPIDAALATVDLVASRLRQGKLFSDAITAAIPLVETLNRNRLASSALIELFRCETEQITAELLDQVKQQLEAARERTSRSRAQVIMP